jgi:O-acetyl-ADP-ribose deacetylase (regulator of RNase III)
MRIANGGSEPGTPDRKTSTSPATVSTGAYGYPIAEAARIAVRTARDFGEGTRNLEECHFVAFSDANRLVYEQVLDELQ